MTQKPIPQYVCDEFKLQLEKLLNQLPLPLPEAPKKE